MHVGAALLVGGRSSRMGGGCKPHLVVGGQTLFDRAVRALSVAGCAPIIAAGPVLDDAAQVRWVREDPPFAGPVAALAAALEAVPAPGPEWMLLLAGDLPRVESIVERLCDRTGRSASADAHVFTADGHPQWLAGVYRTASLRRALAGVDVAGASCRAVLGGLEIEWLTDEDGVTADVDTPADLRRVRAEFEEES